MERKRARLGESQPRTIIALGTGVRHVDRAVNRTQNGGSRAAAPALQVNNGTRALDKPDRSRNKTAVVCVGKHHRKVSIAWRPNPSDCNCIASGWVHQARGDAHKLHGLAVSVLNKQHAYVYRDGVLTIAEFHKQWAVTIKLLPPADHGPCDFSAVGAQLMGGLPASYWAAVLSYSPSLAAKFAHFHTPPPRIWQAMHVGRPDLFWLVATAWHTMKQHAGATLQKLTDTTESVCCAVWHVDSGTQAYADILKAFRIAQIVAVVTTPGGKPDVTINGSPNNAMASVTIAPRDKMLAAIVLAWSSDIAWAANPPPGAPPSILTFIGNTQDACRTLQGGR